MATVGKKKQAFHLVGNDSNFGKLHYTPQALVDNDGNVYKPFTLQAGPRGPALHKRREERKGGLGDFKNFTLQSQTNNTLQACNAEHSCEKNMF